MVCEIVADKLVAQTFWSQTEMSRNGGGTLVDNSSPSNDLQELLKLRTNADNLSQCLEALRARIEQLETRNMLTNGGTDVSSCKFEY